ncbi:MAG: MmgE/PrpD family protein [Polaromonas sp.]|nr:MmgE/PrpD family protein [Polaromonas sp.]
MTGLTQELAAYVARPTFGDDEQSAFDIARTGFVDTIGTMMAGCHEPVVRIILAHVGATQAPGEAPVPFVGTMLPAAQAACVNGVAAHALDYDDVALSAHTSTVLVPAILAEGHLLDVSGLEALRAYVVGYEVWAELFARELDPYHLKGWHPTGVFGTVAAAASVAYLHRLPEAQTRQALAIAASMASGLVANFGTMTKPLHAGRAAACAIEAVRLSMLGLTSAPDVFEHPAGYLNALSPAGRVERTRPATDLGKTLRILETGLSIKRYPVCYSGHRVIDGVLAIAERENLQPRQVRRVRVTIGAAQASMLRNHRPQTGLEAKFSVEFAVAAALVARQVGLTQLSDSFVDRDDVRGLLDKVIVDITERPCPIDPAFSFADRVVIDLVDGRSFDSGDIRFALGNAKLPLDAAGLRQKFMDCIAAGASSTGTRPPDADAGLYERIAQLQSLASLRQLFS